MEASPHPSLPGTAWKVTSVAGTPVLGHAPITFQFDAEGGISGDTSCNIFGAACELEPHSLRVGPLRTTRRAAEPAIMQQEQKFLETLGGVTAWKITNGTLTLSSPKGDIRAVAHRDSDRLH